MVVKVYGPAYAACPQRVLTCLVELGVEFELISIDLESREQKTPNFMLLQPFGQVPVIEDGDFRLFESRAIIRYYAAKYASSSSIDLLGSTLEERALTDQWLEVEGQNYNPLVYNLAVQLMVLPRSGVKTDMAVVQDCKMKLEKVLDVYEQRLSKSKYLAGDSFTLADLTHLPNTRFLTTQGSLERLVKERKFVHSWWLDISSRPAWKKVMELSH